MRNLYQKLSDENQQKLMDYGKQYPTTTAILLGVLNQEQSWSKITLGDSLALWFIFEPVKPFDFDAFINFFENEKDI
jgi:hypothetical protein